MLPLTHSHYGTDGDWRPWGNIGSGAPEGFIIWIMTTVRRVRLIQRRWRAKPWQTLWRRKMDICHNEMHALPPSRLLPEGGTDYIAHKQMFEHALKNHRMKY